MLQGEHSAILSTFIKLSFVIKNLVLSIFEWPLETGFTVCIEDEDVSILWSRKLNSPACESWALFASASSKGSDEPAQGRSLAKAFASCITKVTKYTASGTRAHQCLIK